MASVVAVVNKEYRAKDESHLYPVCGKFNATERAIRKASKIGAEIGGFRNEGYYRDLLDSLLSEIVNKEV